MTVCSGVIIFLGDYLASYEWWAITIVASISVILVVIVIIIWRQPQNFGYITFRVSVFYVTRGQGSFCVSQSIEIYKKYLIYINVYENNCE